MKRLIIAVVLAFAMATASSATPKSQADTVVIATSNLATPMKVTVIQPKQALEKDNDRRYPTVYLLNGFSGDYRTWPKMVGTLDSLANQYGMIFVCPDGRDSWYWDSPVDPKMQMESFFINDLVPYIDKHFPTINNPAQRAITGLSMGGHGALWLAIRHSDIFGNAGSMSGGVDIRPFPENWKMKQRLGEYDKNRQRWTDYTVAGIIPQLKKGQLNITFDCGTSDVFTKVNDQLHQTLLERGIEHDYTSRPGGHNQKYWKNSILYHLLFFNEQFKKQPEQR